MPVRNCVVMPSLGLFPVQINPHYIDAVISGHMGETRDERIAEFCAINPDEIVVALREGSGFHITGNELHYFSGKNEGFKLFQHNKTFLEQFDTSALADRSSVPLLLIPVLVTVGGIPIMESLPPADRLIT